MQVDIRARKIEIDEALGAHVDHRLRFALGRFGGRIAKVMVRFEEATGARGGVDRQCQIDVALQPSGNVLVDGIDADLHAVVDRDLQRRRDAGRP